MMTGRRKSEHSTAHRPLECARDGSCPATGETGAAVTPSEEAALADTENMAHLVDCETGLPDESISTDTGANS